MNKPRWACTTCGMYSSRRDSVKRHIDKVHDGTGIIVSFIDYLVGRLSEVYVPGIRPTYIKKKTGTRIDYLDVFEQEFVRVLSERTINNYFDPPSKQQIGAATTMRGGYYYYIIMAKLRMRFLGSGQSYARGVPVHERASSIFHP
jgi:hypothetical protein